MPDILLAKPKLPPDWIDVSVGEPHVLRDILLHLFKAEPQDYQHHINSRMWEYPSPTGYRPLVDLLEAKHGAPVIITNGAKQALGASFHALKRMGKSKMGMRTPYWALIPPLAKMHGLQCIDEYDYSWDSYLSLTPNNPDGFSEDLEDYAGYCKQKKIPLIHDAAYYTHTYLPNAHQLKQFGDIQIYSISKMFGLSGLRLGYVVCPNEQFYHYIQEYMESMTVGVSIVSQIYLTDLLNRMNAHPGAVKLFEETSALALHQAKRLALQIDPAVLQVPDQLLANPGMFGWFKVGPQFNPNKAKINFIDGALFGGPGMVRMNLAFDYGTMTEIVRRLNSSVG